MEITFDTAPVIPSGAEGEVEGSVEAGIDPSAPPAFAGVGRDDKNEGSGGGALAGISGSMIVSSVSAFASPGVGDVVTTNASCHSMRITASPLRIFS